MKLQVVFLVTFMVKVKDQQDYYIINRIVLLKTWLIIFMVLKDTRGERTKDYGPMLCCTEIVAAHHTQTPTRGRGITECGYSWVQWTGREAQSRLPWIFFSLLPQCTFSWINSFLCSPNIMSKVKEGRGSNWDKEWADFPEFSTFN